MIYDELEFLIKTATPEFIAEKYGVNASAVATLIHDIVGLRAYIEANAPVVESPVEVESAPVLEFVQQKQDFGYAVTPRHRYVFIRPCPEGHMARGIFPKSEVSDQDIGFIHASVIDDLKPGYLVSYDKFSAIGGGMDVVDDEGSPIYVVMIDEVAISSVLERKETKYVG